MWLANQLATSLSHSMELSNRLSIRKTVLPSRVSSRGASDFFATLGGYPTGLKQTILFSMIWGAGTAMFMAVGILPRVAPIWALVLVDLRGLDASAWAQ